MSSITENERNQHKLQKQKIEKKDYYIISDVHGNYEALVELVDIWRLKHKDSQLLFIGDIIDRGERSYDCLMYVLALVEQENAIYLKGNHEELFVDWAKGKDFSHHYLYYKIGGLYLVESLYNKISKEHQRKQKEDKDFIFNKTEMVRKEIENNYTALIKTLDKLPFYHKSNHFLFVHAGVSPDTVYAEDIKEDDALWIRNEFYESNDLALEQEHIVFGHTPTHYMGNGNGEVWVSSCKRKIGIDGGGFLKNGRVNALLVDTTKQKEAAILAVYAHTNCKQKDID